MTATSSVGATIRERRLAAGLTLVELAERSGLSQPFLSQVENGRAHPSMESLYRIASALATTPQALFGGGQAAAQPSVARANDPTVPQIDTDGESLRRLLLPGDAPFHVVELAGQSDGARVTVLVVSGEKPAIVASPAATPRWPVSRR